MVFNKTNCTKNIGKTIRIPEGEEQWNGSKYIWVPVVGTLLSYRTWTDDLGRSGKYATLLVKIGTSEYKIEYTVTNKKFEVIL